MFLAEPWPDNGTIPPAAIRLLVVDDDPHTLERLQPCLHDAGCRVDGVNSAERARERLFSNGEHFDVLLMDIRPPHEDCLTLTRELRVYSEVGIILTSWRDDVIDRVVGLECGADKYLSKPLAPREVLLFARNLSRRVRHSREALALQRAQQRMVNFADWRLDVEQRELVDRHGHRTSLSFRETQLLSVFLGNSGRILNRDQLMGQLCNREWLPDDRSIDMLISRLRRKLRDDPSTPQLIVTIHGLGYLFTALPTRPMASQGTRDGNSDQLIKRIPVAESLRISDEAEEAP